MFDDTGPVDNNRRVAAPRCAIGVIALMSSLCASSIASATGIKLETRQFSTTIPESISDGGQLAIPVLGPFPGPILITVNGQPARVDNQLIVQTTASKVTLDVQIVGVLVTSAAEGACPNKPETKYHLIASTDTAVPCLYLQRGNVDWTLAEPGVPFTVTVAKGPPDVNPVSLTLDTLQGSLGGEHLTWIMNNESARDKYTEFVYSTPAKQSVQQFLDIDADTASYANLLRERIVNSLCIDPLPKSTDLIINSLRTHLRLFVDDTEVSGAIFAGSGNSICLNIPARTFQNAVLDQLATAIKNGMKATVSVRSVDAGTAQLRTFSAEKLQFASPPKAHLLSEGKVVTNLNPVRPMNNQFDELCLEIASQNQPLLGNVLGVSASDISLTSSTGKALVTFQQSGVVQFIQVSDDAGAPLRMVRGDVKDPPALRSLLARSASVRAARPAPEVPATRGMGAQASNWYCAPLSFEGGATDISLVAVGAGNEFPDGDLQVRMSDVSGPIARLNTGAFGHYDVRDVKTMSWIGTGVVATNRSLSGRVPQSFFAVRGHIPLIGAWFGAPRTFTVEGEVGAAGTVGFGSEDEKSAIGGGIGMYGSMCMRVPRSQVSRACFLLSLDGLATNPNGDRVNFGLAGSVMLMIGFAFQP